MHPSSVHLTRVPNKSRVIVVVIHIEHSVNPDSRSVVEISVPSTAFVRNTDRKRVVIFSFTSMRKIESNHINVK